MGRRAKPDCRACGLCCVSFEEQDAYCDLVEEDLDRLRTDWLKKNTIGLSPWDLLMSGLSGLRPPHLVIKTKWKRQRSGPFRGTAVCACVALRGTLLKETRCSIYENRPRACREAVKPGDKACVEIRRLMHDGLERMKF